MHALGLAAAVLAGALVAPHPNSTSSSRVLVSGAAAELAFRCQAAALIEALPAVDADRDGALSGEELASGRGAVEAYVLARYRLRSVPATPGEPVEPEEIRGALTDLTARVENAGGPFSEQWIDLSAGFTAGAPIEELEIEFGVFFEKNPSHADYAEVRFGDEPPWNHAFRAEESRHRFPSLRRFAEIEGARRPIVLLEFLRQGFEHILSGYDHLCFVAALLMGAASLRGLAWTVTAFTASHSVTLALSSLDLLAWRPQSRLVELAIALSIAYVAAENLLHRAPRRIWLEAFLFGLVHGLGFGGQLEQSLLGESQRLTALVGFNLGVELGQLAVVIPVALVLARLSRATATSPNNPAAQSAAGGGEPRWLAPRWARRWISAGVCAAGLYFFAQRAWFT